MKTSVASRLITLCVALAPAFLLGQAGIPPTPPADVPLLPVNGSTLASEPPAYEIPLKWNERAEKVLSISIKNESDQPLKIYGVQATGGVYVVDIPTNLAPGEEDAISFVHEAPENTDGESDLIRLLTNKGVKVYRLNIVRRRAVSFDAREVIWTAGGLAETKTVTLSVAPDTVTPQAVRATGGATASLEKVDDTTWKVNITPPSTVKSGKFAVFVDFNRPLPGQATVIVGTLGPQG